MKKIAEQIIGIVNNTGKNFEGEKNYEELKEASEEYNEMVRLGIIKKKGYNLLSVDQTNIKQPAFNSPS